MKKIFLFFLIIGCLGLLGNLLRYTATKDFLNLICIVMFAVYNLVMANNFKFTFKANTIIGKVSKETRREQRYNANLHNLFVKAQEEIANE